MNVFVIILWILLWWWLLSPTLGILIGKMIKMADRRERPGVVSRAIREASAPDRYAAMDEHIGILGHDAVLKWLPSDIVDDFNGVNEQRAYEEEIKAKRREKRRLEIERRIAQSADPIQTKRQIVAEILGTDPDYSTARERVQAALDGQYQIPPERIRVDSFDGRHTRYYAEGGIVRPMDNGPARW